MHDIDDTFDLRERMQHAVGGLSAPDVMTDVRAHVRRHRVQRRVKYAAGGVAAVAVVGAIGYPLAQGTPQGGGDRPDRQPYASDSPSSASGTSDSANGGCPTRPEGWWNMPADQVRANLAERVPDGVTVDRTDDASTGWWSGNLREGTDPDFAQVTLLPPPGGGPRTVPGPHGAVQLCATNEPMQDPTACDPDVTCEEIRDVEGEVIGVVSERVETTIENGAEVPTDESYILATLRGPDGGVVEIYVAEGTRQDTPDTVHDPADRPALTLAQVRDLLTDPVWTAGSGRAEP